MSWIKIHPFLVIMAVAFCYYAVLSAKSLTIVFAGEDAAGWLATGNWWLVAQPMGSPLYVFLQHLVSAMPGNQVILATLLLSCLPAAVTTALVYSCTVKLTGEKIYGIVAALALAACAIFLSQSTMVEEYALAGMFMTLAVWFKLRGNEKLVWLALGLASGVHFLLAVVSFIWLIVDWKEWRRNLRALPIYIAVGILPYSYVLILMAMDTPKMSAGNLSIEGLTQYFQGPAGRITGAISVYEFPLRLKDAGALLLTAFGVGIVPLIVGLKKHFNHKWLIFSPVAFLFLFYLTSFDRYNWTFLTMCVPVVCITIGWGLSKMKRSHIAYVTVGTAALLIANSCLMNSNMLTNQYPVARETMNDIMALPNGSVVVGIPRFTSIAWYCATLGKDVVPLATGYTDNKSKFDDYIIYLNEEFGLEGDNSFEMIVSAWEDGREVYLATGTGSDPVSKELKSCYNLEGSGMVQRITGFTGFLPSFADSAITIPDR